MDDKLDLWGNITENNGSASSVLSLMQEQANLLETKTGGKVKADFSLIHYQYKTKRNYASALQSVLDTVRVLSPLTEPAGEIVEQDERQDLEDASHFYEKGKYKFEIYSSKYKFRLLTLEYQSVFPLNLEIEYGILEDKVTTEEIKSIEELKSLLGSVFTSNKVRFIIQKMIDAESN